jgi:glycosyltransferase involved in cell wall biosynthesis
VAEEHKLPLRSAIPKLLFIIDNLQFGGGERVFAQIINGLPPEKYEIFLASKPSDEFYQAIHNNRVRFFPINFSKRINLPLIPKLSKIIKENKIEIVHGQGARAEFYARLANRLAGSAKYISTIAMPVDGFDVGSLRKKSYRLFDSQSERFVDRFLVVSDMLKNMMINGHGIRPENVVRIYNGIELDHYSPINKDSQRNKIIDESGLDQNTILIGAIGRLVWQKGFEYLIESIPLTVKDLPNLRILLIGDGPLRERLGALAERLDVTSNVIFAGFRSDIKEILSSIDILVIPSLLEGFPVITLEGMAMAKPIIATNIDGIKEQIIDGKSGILIPPRDPNAIANAIIKLTNNKNLAENIGLAARKRVEEEFTVGKMVAETEKVYSSVLGLH